MRFYLTYILIAISISAGAQKADWLSKTDCGALINMNKVSADPMGNVFVGGTYNGETVFRSDKNDTLITKYAYSKKAFVTRYNAAGKPTMVVQFRGCDYMQIGALKALPSGECLVVVDCNGAVEFVDPFGNHTKAGNNGRDNIYCITANGTIKWSTSINVANINILETADDGTIYIHGTWNRYSQSDNCLLSLFPDGTPKDTIRFSGGSINCMAINGGDLLAGVVYPTANTGWHDPKAQKYFDVQPMHFAFYRIDRTSMQMMKYYEIQVPMRVGYEANYTTRFQCSINTSSGVTYTDIMLPTEHGTTLFLDKKYTRDGGSMHIMRLNTKGEIVADKGFNCQYYNFSMLPLENGNLALTVAVWGTAFHYGNDSLALPGHTMFIDELVVMKLDQQLKRIWWFTAGGTASNYHASLLCRDATGRLYITSDLMESGTILGRHEKLIWSSAMYVMRFGE